MRTLFKNHPFIIVPITAVITLLLMFGVSFLETSQMKTSVSVLMIFALNLSNLVGILVMEQNTKMRIILALVSQVMIGIIGVAIIVFNA